METGDIAILVLGGLAAGAVNTLAGGGSLLTVPLLVLVGLPGTVANGTNRIGVLVQSLTAIWRFRAAGVGDLRAVVPVLIPVVAGSLAGAALAAQLSDEGFEKVFGIVMLLLLVPTLRPPRSARGGPATPWPAALRWLVFLAIGFYGGALQAGVGIVLLVALSHTGLDLVRGNAVKVAVVAAVTLVALPVFVLEDQVRWLAGGVLAAGQAAGAALGARLAVAGGERLIRPVLAAAVVALAGHMIGLY